MNSVETSETTQKTELFIQSRGVRYSEFPLYKTSEIIHDPLIKRVRRVELQEYSHFRMVCKQIKTETTTY